MQAAAGFAQFAADKPSPDRRVPEDHCRLDIVDIQPRTLRIAGWAVSRGAGGLDGIRLIWGARAFPALRLRKGLPSPDVAATYPGCDRAGTCRFDLQAPLDPDGPHPSVTSLVQLTPVFAGGVGTTQFVILEQFAPAPADTAGAGGGPSDRENDLAFLTTLIQVAGLRPADATLDVDCGAGPTARCLVHYLLPSATYEGFDPDEARVAWCHGNVTPRFPNFRFRQHPTHARAGASNQSADVRFPYENDRFDFVLVRDRFKHAGAGVPACIEEIRRVLRPGGRCTCFLFLLNPESRRLLSRNRVHRWSPFRTRTEVVAGSGATPGYVGLKESLFLQCVKENGLQLAGIHYGSWPGRLSAFGYHDMLILRK